MPTPPIEPRPGRGWLFVDARAKLAAALRGLDLDRSEAKRCIDEMLSWLDAATDADAILRAIRKYPLHRRVVAGGGLGRITLPRLAVADARKVAAAILAERASLGGRFETVEQVAAIPEVDEVALAQLIVVGCSLGQLRPPGPIVGVLLPLRIETRFTAPVGPTTHWTMRLRVVPDAPSLDRHHDVPTDVELDALETMWVNADADLTTELGKAQWRRLANQVGAARAAWLARTFPAQVSQGAITIDRPAVTRDDLGTSRIAGLPPTIEVWMARGGAAPTRVATLTVDHQRLALDFPDPSTNETRWWTSFQEAVSVGLGAEIDLGQARPDDIDVLYAIGIGDVDPATVFADHRDAGVLGVLPASSPTNSVAGDPAADLARDPETWRTLLVSPPPQPGTEAVSAALTGKPGTLAPLPGGERDDGDVNASMVAALWPVLWGHALKDVWGLGGDVFAVGEWAARNLIPEGPLPAVRIGDQPYGLLPATSLRRWVAQPGDPAIESRLVPVVGDVRRGWADAAEAAGTSIGADTERLLDLVGRVPLSRAYAWRWMLPLESVSAITWGVDGGVAWPDLVSWWDDARSPSAPARSSARPPVRHARVAAGSRSPARRARQPASRHEVGGRDHADRVVPSQPVRIRGWAT